MNSKDILTKIEFIKPEGTIKETGALIQIIIPISKRDDGYNALEVIRESLTTSKQTSKESS